MGVILNNKIGQILINNNFTYDAHKNLSSGNTYYI